MKPGNGVRHSPCPGTKPRKWGKLPTNEYTEKNVTSAATIADRLRIGSERTLYPNFARALNTLSEVGGVLAQIADGLPQTPDAEGYQRLLT
jgi:hypothetical protein